MIGWIDVRKLFVWEMESANQLQAIIAQVQVNREHCDKRI